MNSDTIRFVQSVKKAIDDAGGLESYRKHVLKHLQLKAVIKESHCSPVHQLEFNTTSPELCNLFATVGSDQAAVYDDAHMGDSVAVVVHFTNKTTPHAPGGELITCAWINATDTTHPHGEALLAVGGKDCCVSCISVVESRVVSLLQGHTRPIVDVTGAAACPGRVVSLAEGGQVRVWDAHQETCLGSADIAGATCVACSPDGCTILVGGQRGQCTMLHVDAGGPTLDNKGPLAFPGVQCNERIECMRFTTASTVVVRACNGQMWSYNVPSQTVGATWKVPGCAALGGGSTKCRFGSTSDGSYVVAGNSAGDVFVFDTVTGTRAACCKAIRVSAPVRACGMSDDGRHVVAVLGNGYVFRYEYRAPKVADEGDDKENMDINGDAMEESSDDE